MQARKTNIEVVRLISIFVVILFHLDPILFNFGYLGVDVFFILSGYFAGKHIFHAGSDFNVLHYLFRRIVRIIPAISACSLILTVLLGIFAFPAEVQITVNSLVSSNLGISNFYFWKQNNYFEFSEYFQPLLHTWSTSVELQFFVFWSILGHFLRHRPKLILVVFSLLSASALYFVLYNNLGSRQVAYFLSPFRFWEFAIGIWVFIFQNYLDKKEPKRFSSYHGVFGVIIVFFIMFLLGIQVNYLSVEYLLSIAVLGVLFFFSARGDFRDNNIAMTILNYCSRYTFVLFVVHYPIICIFNQVYDVYGFVEYVYLFSSIFLAAGILYRVSDYYYFESKVKLLATLTALYLATLAVVVYALSNHSFTFSKEYFKISNDLNVYSDIIKYDKKEFTKYVTKAFDGDINRSSSEHKLLLVGDSYAKDFYNVLLESGIVNRQQVSLHYVPAQCGFLQVISKNPTTDCVDYVGNLFEKTRGVSNIILANFWNKDNLSTSLVAGFDNSIFQNKNLIFVHEKHVTMPKLRKLLKSDLTVSHSIPANIDRIVEKNKNKLLLLSRKTAQNVSEFDYYHSIPNCSNCFQISTYRNLLTLDGQHLSKAGAVHFGHMLREKFRSGQVKLNF